MIRPIYENEQDRSRERQVIDKLLKPGQKAYKLKMENRLDFAVVDRSNTVVALVEVKCRTNKMRAYPSYMLDIPKVMAARQLSEACNCPAFLFVQWADALGYISFGSPFQVGFGGRTDRSDSQDVGLMAYFDLDMFREV